MPGVTENPEDDQTWDMVEQADPCGNLFNTTIPVVDENLEIKNHARLASEAVDVDEQRPLKIQHSDHARLASEAVDVNEQRPLKIQHTDHARLASEAVDVDEQRPLKIQPSDHARLASEAVDVDEQCPLKIQRTDSPIHDPTSMTFLELFKSMGAPRLDDNVHKKIVDDLMVYDTKRKARVPTRFCGFHLAGFNLDEISTAPLGPPYQPDPLPPGIPINYAAGSVHYYMARSSIDVISIRVVKIGPHYTYPVEIYGKVVARDEIDYKCVHLFNCERNDAQTINSEKDMLALTGPYRALVTMDDMYFEFDLKIKGKGNPDDDAQFSQGVIRHFRKPDDRRIKYQLPSFLSTVKLVLQHVKFPVAASLEVSVVNQEPNDPLVPFPGKITAGTSRNYRHHMLLYDGSVRSRVLVSKNGSLALNRNLVTVYGYVEDLALVEDKKLVVHVCFLDASCEIEDKDKMDIEDEDEDEDDVDVDDYDEVEDEDNVDDDGDDEEREEDPKNVVSLRYPLRETVWEQGRLKLKVKVNWTAVPEKLKDMEFFYRNSCLPDGFEPNYRDGGFH